MATADEEIRRRLLDVAPEPNGRVRLARRKKPDSMWIKAAEVNNSFFSLLDFY
jgi:hypothetical protein